MRILVRRVTHLCSAIYQALTTGRRFLPRVILLTTLLYAGGGGLLSAFILSAIGGVVTCPVLVQREGVVVEMQVEEGRANRQTKGEVEGRMVNRVKRVKESVSIAGYGFATCVCCLGCRKQRKEATRT